LDAGGSRLKLALLDDACSRLLLHRSEKYEASLERVATALQQAGLSAEPEEPGLWAFFRHVLFSWVVGNGDLHTKNIALLRWLSPGQLGSSPSALQPEYSPVYDLLNTRLPLPGDQFALTLNGRRDHLRIRDFEALAARWDGAGDTVRELAEVLVAAVFEQLDEVLALSRLGDEEVGRYRQIVEDSAARLRI
jgi:serine/threonine-protein kinase HipA